MGQLQDWTVLAAGDHHFCTLSGSDVYCQGRNDFCQVAPHLSPGQRVDVLEPVVFP